MPRSLKKGPFVDHHLQAKVEKASQIQAQLDELTNLLALKQTLDPSAVVLDDIVAYRKPQTGAFFPLCRIKRRENVLYQFFIHAFALVADRYDDGIFNARRCNENRLIGAWKGLAGVFYDVDHDLFQVPDASLDTRYVFV